MNPTPRRLILDLLLAAEGRPLAARDAIAASSLFGARESSVRVALARLSADGLIDSTDRGWYQLSAKGHELADDVATWRTAEQRTRAWREGHYLLVHTGGLGRGNRSALRRRQRALDLLGFRSLAADLHLRPDNLAEDLPSLRRRLRALGLPAEATLCAATGFEPADERRVRALWDGKALNRIYRNLRAELEAWLKRAPRLETDVAAREAFLLGSRGIRQVVFDPRLPAPMVDIEARQAFVASVHRFDRAGQVIWRHWIEQQREITT